MPKNKLENVVNRFIKEYYVPRLVSGLRSIGRQDLESVSEKVADRILKGGRIFAFGNGGSESISEAFIYSLEQRVGYEFEFDTYSNPKLSEATDFPNSLLFNHRIKRSARNGDLALLASASGNSDNINNASVLCREKKVETISVSADGRISNDPMTKADYAVIIPIKDQQILEDVTLGFIYLITQLAQYKTAGTRFNLEEVRLDYADALFHGLRGLSSANIISLTYKIIAAYKDGKSVRIDAPDSGLLSINAKHMQHNLKWDVFQNVENRLRNRVHSGLPTYHFSGVGNDGGEGFNYTIEVDDNSGQDDVQIFLARDLNSKSVQHAIRTADRKGMTVYSFCHNSCDEYVSSNVAQSLLHITSRLINSTFLTEASDLAALGKQLRVDLALLRQKNQTAQKLEDAYR